MNAKKILAASLVALLAVASFAPAFAADKTNVMLNSAFYEAINITEETADRGTFDMLVDGLYAIGPTHMEGSVNAKVASGNVYTYHDADGVEDDAGDYLCMVTYELDKVYTVDSFKLIYGDLVPLANITKSMITWLPRGFAILTSTTGEAGSWNVAWRGDDLHDTVETEVYKYVEAAGDLYPYYYIEGKFEKAVDAKFVKIAFTNLNNDAGTASGRYFNMSELEVYGTASGNAPATEAPATEAPATEAPATEAPATEAPATEAPATEAPATEAPATEAPATQAPATQEPEAPATFDFVIVPAIAIAAAAAGVVVLKKKEN